MAIASVLTTLVAACSSADPLKPVVQLVEVSRAVPEEAKKPCAAPVTIPARAIKAGEIVPLWNRDRRALRECEARRAAAVGAVEQK